MKLKDFALRTEGTGTRAPTDGERTGGKEGGRVDDGQDSRAVGHQRERDVECLLGTDQVDCHRPERQSPRRRRSGSFLEASAA
jgi:hypothetical protein